MFFKGKHSITGKVNGSLTISSLFSKLMPVQVLVFT